MAPPAEEPTRRRDLDPLPQPVFFTLVGLNECQSRKFKRETLRRDWSSVFESVGGIHSLAKQFKIEELEAAKLAEEVLANARDESRAYRLELFDWLAAGILALSAILALSKAWTPEGMASGLFWGVLISIPWVFLMILFAFLNPKYSQWLVNMTRWWAATLTTILTVLIPFFVEQGETNLNLYTAIQVLFFALLMMVPVHIIGVISKKTV